jgi:hypothetical protein
MRTLTLFILPLVMACALTHTAKAEITKQDHYFKLLCIEEKSTGFNWKNGDWEQTIFRPRKLLVEKVKIEPIEPTFPRSGLCALHVIGEPTELKADKKSQRISACYNLRALGNAFENFDTIQCIEHWKGTGNNQNLIDIQCNGIVQNIVLKPTGWFHAANVHDQLEDKTEKNKKASLTLSVGKCDIIE